MLLEYETTTTGTGDVGTATEGGSEGVGAVTGATGATEGAEGTGTGAAGEGGSGKGADEFDPDRAMATIKNLRAEEKDLKRQLKEARAAQDELAKLKADALSEEEKKDARLAELEQGQQERDYELSELRLGLAVHNLAGKLPIVDAELVLALLDRDSLELDDDGVAQNLEKVVLDLLEAKPLLKGRAATAQGGRTDGGAGRRESPPLNLTAEELEAARELGQDPAEYAQMKDVKNVRDWQRLQEERRAAAKTA